MHLSTHVLVKVNSHCIMHFIGMSLIVSLMKLRTMKKFMLTLALTLLKLRLMVSTPQFLPMVKLPLERLIPCWEMKKIKVSSSCGSGQVLIT